MNNTIENLRRIRVFISFMMSPYAQDYLKQSTKLKTDVEKLILELRTFMGSSAAMKNYDLLGVTAKIKEFQTLLSLTPLSSSETRKKINDTIDGLYLELNENTSYDPIFYYKNYFLNNSADLEHEKSLEPFRKMNTDVWEFKAWFQGSKVVDEQNEPLIVYHGSKNTQFTDFKFDIFPGVYFAQNKSYSEWFAKLGPNDTLFQCYIKVLNPIDLKVFGVDKVKYDELVGYVELKYGFKLTPNKAIKALSDAQGGLWAWQYLRGGVDWLKQIIKDGRFDGLTFYENNPQDMVDGKENVTPAWMVFKPTQIKEAIGNLTFSSYSNDIRFKKGGEI